MLLRRRPPFVCGPGLFALGPGRACCFVPLRFRLGPVVPMTLQCCIVRFPRDIGEAAGHFAPGTHTTCVAGFCRGPGEAVTPSTPASSLCGYQAPRVSCTPTGLGKGPFVSPTLTFQVCSHLAGNNTEASACEGRKDFICLIPLQLSFVPFLAHMDSGWLSLFLLCTGKFCCQLNHIAVVLG